MRACPFRQSRVSSRSACQRGDEAHLLVLGDRLPVVDELRLEVVGDRDLDLGPLHVLVLLHPPLVISSVRGWEARSRTHRLSLAPALRAPARPPPARAPNHTPHRWSMRHGARLALGLGSLERLALSGVARALRLDERLLLADALLVELAEALLGDPLVPAGTSQGACQRGVPRAKAGAGQLRELRAATPAREEPATHVCFQPL